MKLRGGPVSGNGIMTGLRSATSFLLAIASPILLPLLASAQNLVVNPLPGDDTRTFYHLPEGGAVLPLALYRTLEVIDSTSGQPTGQTFAERMGDYGFLDDPESDLPVGFGIVSLDFLGGLKGLSINCAACHVGELHYATADGAVRLRINGGPNLADVRRFSQDVYQSLAFPLGTPGRLLRLLVDSGRLQPDTVALLEELPIEQEGAWDCTPARAEAQEFAAAVNRLLEPSRPSRAVSSAGARSRSPSLQAAAALDDIARQLTLLVAELNYFQAQGRFPLSTREGFGRLDAFATVRFLLYPRESAEFPFTAPVSVPHLWGIGRKKWLHWNNNTNSTLQRNIVQALGMGAVQGAGGVHNVLLPNLVELESIAQQIAPPRWPVEVLGPLDAALVERGAVLYDERCASCHSAGTTDATTGLVEYPLFTLDQTGTDPNDALNFHRPVGRSSFSELLGKQAKALERWYYERRDPQHPVPIPIRIEWSGGPARLPAVWRDPLAKSVNAPVYAALPLTGVWATAPYLHNNSVPTLRDLLRPATERPAVFMVGHRDFDPVNVGYVQPADVSSIPPLFRFDTHDAGNANTGHEGSVFGAEGLSADDVNALLEYLKSL